MTPKEITFRLFDLKCVFQAQPKQTGSPLDGLMGLFSGMNPNPAGSEDYSQSGYNAEGEELENIEEPEPDLTLEVLTDPKELVKSEAWFLGQAPPKEFPARLAGQMMSIGIVDRQLLIRMEEIPWGVLAGEIKINCEYITNIDVKNGSLLIFSKVGNVALQIHEITESQCIV